MFRIPTLAAALAATLFGSSLLAQDYRMTMPGLIGYTGQRIITVVVKVDGKELQIRIKDGKVRAYLDGNRIAQKNIETKGTEQCIRNDAGRKIATVEIDRNNLTLQPALVGANRARLGLTLGCIDEALARHLDLDPEDVRIVQKVTKGAAAEKASIKKHDVLLRIEGKAMAQSSNSRFG